MGGIMAAGESPIPKLWRWSALFSPTTFLLVLLSAEVFLALSERFKWFAFNEQKGFAVLIAAGIAASALLISLVWSIVAWLTAFRFQYGLAAMIGMVLMVATLAGWLGNAIRQARSQKDAIQEILNQRGGVEYGLVRNFDIMTSVAPSRTLQFQATHVPQRLRQVLGEDFFAHVRAANIRGNVPMAALLDFPEIQQLRVDGPVVTDQEMADLRIMRKLVYLSLNHTDITSAGLVHIRDHIQLRTLWLRHTNVDDSGLKHLAELRELRVLLLDSTRVTDRGMKDLATMKTLVHLSIDETPVTDAGLADLKQLKNLRRLSLVGTKVTEAGLRDFAKAHPKCEIVH